MGRVTWAFDIIMTLIGKSDSDICESYAMRTAYYLLSVEAYRDTQFDYFTVNASAFFTRFNVWFAFFFFFYKVLCIKLIINFFFLHFLFLNKRK